MSAIGTKQTSRHARYSVANGGIADILEPGNDAADPKCSLSLSPKFSDHLAHLNKALAYLNKSKVVRHPKIPLATWSTMRRNQCLPIVCPEPSSQLSPRSR